MKKLHIAMVVDSYDCNGGGLVSTKDLLSLLENKATK